MKGIFGAEYIKDGLNIKVIKKDGKVFFLPIEDVKALNRWLFLNEKIEEMKKELEDLNSPRP